MVQVKLIDRLNKDLSVTEQFADLCKASSQELKGINVKQVYALNERQAKIEYYQERIDKIVNDWTGYEMSNKCKQIIKEYTKRIQLLNKQIEYFN